MRIRDIVHPLRARRVRGAIVAAGLVALLSSLAACHDEPQPKPAKALPTVPVRTITLQTRAYQAQEEVVGTVRARQHATLEAKVSGRIERMPVELGQRVKAGQLIAQLQVHEIRAKLRQANAVLDQAKADLARVEALLAQNAVTRQDYDAVRARHEVALASVAEARSMLDYATVRAPFAGVITKKPATVGDLATPGRPLVEIEDVAGLRLEVAVPEAVVGGLQVGKTLPVQVAAAPESLDGTIAEVAPSADPNSRTFLVKIDLPRDPQLRTGQFGRALVPVGRTNTLRLPVSAVVARGQMETVFVVAEGRANLRLVKTGKRFGDEVEVLSGLDAGEAVVVPNDGRLVDRQPVEVRL